MAKLIGIVILVIYDYIMHILFERSAKLFYGYVKSHIRLFTNENK